MINIIEELNETKCFKYVYSKDEINQWFENINNQTLIKILFGENKFSLKNLRVGIEKEFQRTENGREIWVKEKKFIPDIIIHKRKTYKDDLLIIEIKKSYYFNELDKAIKVIYDLIKLELSHKETFNYNFSLFLKMYEKNENKNCDYCWKYKDKRGIFMDYTSTL
ncbi:MAG: hypothetical protein GF364_19070 [Candidatus Lokiarchaeota archaeon]|nr:hypothetical protein [Candidatus Lokiarchaeota archaeon]